MIMCVNKDFRRISLYNFVLVQNSYFRSTLERQTVPPLILAGEPSVGPVLFIFSFEVDVLSRVLR